MREIRLRSSRAYAACSDENSFVRDCQCSLGSLFSELFTVCPRKFDPLEVRYAVLFRFELVEVPIPGISSCPVLCRLAGAGAWQCQSRAVLGWDCLRRLRRGCEVRRKHREGARY